MTQFSDIIWNNKSKIIKIASEIIEQTIQNSSLNKFMDDEIKEFPKTADGMIDLFNFMKKFDYINGWQHLWEEYAELIV